MITYNTLIHGLHNALQEEVPEWMEVRILYIRQLIHRTLLEGAHRWGGDEGTRNLVPKRGLGDGSPPSLWRGAELVQHILIIITSPVMIA